VIVLLILNPFSGMRCDPYCSVALYLQGHMNNFVTPVLGRLCSWTRGFFLS